MSSPRKIALLHGWATDPSIWQSVKTQLESAGAEVTCYEMPGYGSRQSESGSISFDGLVDDAIAKLSGNEIWVGWSLGAMVAIATAARQTPAMRSIFAVCPTAKFCCDQEKEDSLAQLRIAVEHDPAKATKRFRRSMPSEKNRRRIAKLIGENQGNEPCASKETLLAGLEILLRADLVDKVNKIGVPIRILSGDEDSIVPVSSGQALHQLIDGSQFTALPCGHIPFLECPDRFMEQLFEFTEFTQRTTASTSG